MHYQVRKYGISEPMMQALYYDLVNKVILRVCIID